MPPNQPKVQPKVRAEFTQEDRKMIMALWKQFDTEVILFQPGRNIGLKEKKNLIRGKILDELNSIRPLEKQVDWASVARVIRQIKDGVKEAGDLEAKAYKKLASKTSGGPLKPFSVEFDPDEELMDGGSGSHNKSFMEIVDEDTIKMISNRAQVPNKYQQQIPEVRNAGDFMKQYHEQRAAKEALSKSKSSCSSTAISSSATSSSTSNPATMIPASTLTSTKNFSAPIISSAAKSKVSSSTSMLASNSVASNSVASNSSANSMRKRRSSSTSAKNDKESLSIQVIQQRLTTEEKRAKLEILRLKAEINVHLYQAAILEKQNPDIEVQVFPVAQEVEAMMGTEEEKGDKEE